MKSYLDQNYNYWNREYHSPNVESFIFRLKSYLLDKYVNKKKKLTVLDFGCGEGANIRYFEKVHGYTAHGVDISEISIKNAKKYYPKKNKFKIIKNTYETGENLFNKKFDLIISVQTLYFLGEEELNIRLKAFNKILKKNGMVFFTMISTQNSYFKKFSNKKTDKNGMTLVNLSRDKTYLNRQILDDHAHYINFTKSEKHLVKRFNIFKKLAIGSYDLKLESLNRSEHHYTFLGMKKS